MNSIKKRLALLENALKSHWVTWRANGGVVVKCFPEQLFSLEEDPGLKATVLDADPGSFADYPLVEFVRAFHLPEEGENNGGIRRRIEALEQHVSSI